MGKTSRELKDKNKHLKLENSFLTSKIEKVILENGRVKRELQVSNARIVELAQEVELFRNGLAFLNEVKEALSDVEKVGEPILEKMVKSSELVPDGMVYDKDSDSLVEIKKEKKSLLYV